MASSSAANQSPMPKIEATRKYIPYPTALAKYEDIVSSPKLFMDTLEKLHATMGTKFMNPIIGGKDLDLHRLFVEVTLRGGIEKIVREKRWKEVTAVFNFPATATNASFVLRKYYMSLIYHYEQIYLFKAKAWSPCVGPFQCLSPSPVLPRSLAESVQPPPEIQTAAVQPSTVNVAELPHTTATSVPVIGSPIVGVIDGKFESGYLVTVKIGSEMLKGVLYQALHNQSSEVPHHQSGVSCHDGANVPTTSPCTVRRRRRKKSEIRRKDPAHPKPNRSGYNFFFAEQHARLKPLHPGKDRDISRMIGELWTKMQESEKEGYQDKAVKDKERYKIEMADYRERLSTGQFISSVVPIQQRPFPEDDHMAESSEKIHMESGDSLQSLENEICTSKSDSEDEIEDKESDLETSFEVEDCSETKRRKKYSIEDDVEKKFDMVEGDNVEALGDVMEENEKAQLEEKGSMPCEASENNDLISMIEKELVPLEEKEAMSCVRDTDAMKELKPSEEKGTREEFAHSETRDSVPGEEKAGTEEELVPSEAKRAMPFEGGKIFF